MRAANGHVRFTPNSGHESGPPQTVMSALPLKMTFGIGSTWYQ